MENLSRFMQDTSAAFNSSGYAFFNIEAHIFCGIIIMILFVRQQNFSDQTNARIILSRILFAEFLYCIAKIFIVLVDVNIIKKSPYMQYCVASINFALLSFIGWFIFMYSELYQDAELFDSLRNKIISGIPFAFNILMLALSPLTGLYFDISGSIMKEGALYSLMIAIILLYPAAALFLVLYRGRSEDKYDLAAICPALLLFCAPFQLLSSKVPFLCFIMIITDILVYMNYFDSLISIDPLTKIANKNGFMRDLTQKFTAGELENLYLFAVDIEDLNAINTEFGRSEGDKALIITAASFRPPDVGSIRR